MSERTACEAVRQRYNHAKPMSERGFVAYNTILLTLDEVKAIIDRAEEADALEAERDRLRDEAFAALRQLDGYVDTLGYDPEDADEDDVTPADARALAARHILHAAINEQDEGG